MEKSSPWIKLFSTIKVKQIHRSAYKIRTFTKKKTVKRIQAFGLTDDKVIHIDRHFRHIDHRHKTYR